MKKLPFNKTIIFFLIVSIFFAGLNIFDITRVQAQTPEPCAQELDAWSTADESSDGSLIAQKRIAYQACLAEKNAENKGNWFTEAIKEVSGGLAKGALPTTLNVIAGLYGIVMVPVLGTLMRISGALVGLAIQYTLNSANIESANVAITTVWSLIRNIFNVTFIFILLYTAILTIIGSASANTKKMIAQVVIAALLINFSLFITRILIDGGNILATNLYNTITSYDKISISDAIMQWTKVAGMFNIENIKMFGLTSPSLFIVIVLQSSLLYITIGVFLYIALLFLVRNVLLIFLMAISPIGFMGDVVPKIKEYSKMWWENLFGQIAIAPIFFVFLLLISKVQGTLTSAINTTENKGFFMNDDQRYLIYFKYVMIIILLIAAVKITKKLSGEVSKFMMSVGKITLMATAAAATGGASIAMGAKGAGGVWAATKKLASGKLGDEPGALGAAARFSRTNFMNTTKTLTQGKVDLDKFEKIIKKSKTEEEKRVTKNIDSGVSDAIDNEKRLKDTQDNIDKQIERTNPQLIKDKDELEKKITEAEKKIAAAEEEEKKAVSEELKANARAKKSEATKERSSAQGSINNLEQERRRVAESMGIKYDDFKKDLKNSNEMVVKALDERNKKINTLAQETEGPLRGIFGRFSANLPKRDRIKLVEKMRATPGKIKIGKDNSAVLNDVKAALGIEDDGAQNKKENKTSEETEKKK